MKILKADAGALANFEVLNFLRSRGAGKDPTRVLASVLPSEFKVFDYLEQSAVCNQTKECICEFLEKCKKYELTKDEVLSIINTRPSSMVEIYPIITQGNTRSDESVEDLVDMVAQVLPPAPSQMESDGIGDDKEENLEEQETGIS